MIGLSGEKTKRRGYSKGKNLMSFREAEKDDVEIQARWSILNEANIE